MRRAVNTARHTRNDGKTSLGQRCAEPLSHAQAIGRARPCPDNRDPRHAVKIGQPPPHVQYRRRIIDLAQPVGVRAVFYGDNLDLLLFAGAQDGLCAR